MDRLTLPLHLAGLAAANLAGHADAPIVARPLIVPALRRTFGPVRVLEWWDGEDARYARLGTRDTRALFLKYRPARGTPPRAYRRFRNEQLYLRNFAPHADVPHAALLHAAHHDAAREAHVVLEDLTDRTVAWSDLSERDRAARLPGVMALVARYHAAWVNSARLAAHLSFPWSPAERAQRAREGFARDLPRDLMGAGSFPAEVTDTARALSREARLEGWFGRAGPVTLAHGDLHFQQVLFGRDSRDQLYLIDYQHAHVAPVGSDVAHLLGVRFSWFERRQLEDELLGAYRHELRARGVHIGSDALREAYAVGLLLNFLSMWERFVREPSPLFKDLLLRVHAAFEEHRDFLP